MLRYGTWPGPRTDMQKFRPQPPETLKLDAFGATELSPDGKIVCRNTSGTNLWLRQVASRLMHREAFALIKLNGCSNISRLQAETGTDWNAASMSVRMR